MISKDDREILIKYRLDQAKQTIGEVGKLIEMDLLNVAVIPIDRHIYSPKINGIMPIDV